MNDVYFLIIGCLLSGIGTVLVLQFSAMRKNLENISLSVGTLNIQIAEVIKDQKWHKEEMEKAENSIAENAKGITKNRERLHSLEGGQSQVLEYLKTN